MLPKGFRITRIRYIKVGKLINCHKVRTSLISMPCCIKGLRLIKMVDV